MLLHVVVPGKNAGVAGGVRSLPAAAALDDFVDNSNRCQKLTLWKLQFRFDSGHFQEQNSS